MWDFIQNQILGMQWLHSLIGQGLVACGLDLESRFGGSLQFFIYDVLKIFILLGTLIFVISYIQSYFPPERTKRILGRFNGLTANILSALLGTITPFCSCSSIPLFMGFTRAGLPLGVTFSFLISSPMVDLGSLVILTSIFGFKIAVLYVVLGLVIAVVGGTILDKMKMERYIEEFVQQGLKPAASSASSDASAASAAQTALSNTALSNTAVTSIPAATSASTTVGSGENSTKVATPNGSDLEMTRKERAINAWEQVKFTFKKVWIYVLIGVAIGAGIHNYIPQDWVVWLLGEQNPFGVLLATLVGVPMYADIFGSIPIAEALLAQGAQLGVVLSFMMAVTTLSLPAMVMLRRILKMPLLLSFIGICILGIVIVGYAFNYMMPWLVD